MPPRRRPNRIDAFQYPYIQMHIFLVGCFVCISFVSLAPVFLYIK